MDRCELESPAVEEESGKPLVALFEVFFSAGGNSDNCGCHVNVFLLLISGIKDALIQKPEVLLLS